MALVVYIPRRRLFFRTAGSGLLFYGNVTIPFVDRFPKGEIYDLLTTRPEDMKNEAKTE